MGFKFLTHCTVDSLKMNYSYHSLDADFEQSHKIVCKYQSPMLSFIETRNSQHPVGLENHLVSCFYCFVK